MSRSRFTLRQRAALALLAFVAAVALATLLSIVIYMPKASALTTTQPETQQPDSQTIEANFAVTVLSALNGKLIAVGQYREHVFADVVACRTALESDEHFRQANGRIALTIATLFPGAKTEFVCAPLQSKSPEQHPEIWK